SGPQSRRRGLFQNGLTKALLIKKCSLMTHHAKTAVLLVNMGGAESPAALRKFLSHMFMDPYILPFAKPFRWLLSTMISSLRYKKSWKKYEMIGGTPLLRSTQATTETLQLRLGADYLVRYAYSYSDPMIEKAMESIRQEGIDQIVVLPLYPQSSYTTTSSVLADVERFQQKHPSVKIRFVHQFFKERGFIAFWTNRIREHERQVASGDHALLIFSAHSIPEFNIVKGDTYAAAVHQSAASIAESMGRTHAVAFQSGMSGGKWVGPDLKRKLMTLDKDQEVVILPISFVHENLETCYDLDCEILPFASQVLGFRRITRVALPEADPLFIDLLAEIVGSDGDAA
ncbi:MAG: ferrochelatase, partial [Marinilabiliales bacterium]|nr:ferrochelatase [Marinilabiliales bacterium]